MCILYVGVLHEPTINAPQVEPRRKELDATEIVDWMVINNIGRKVDQGFFGF
jgi:hypothetical protein